MKTTAVTTSLLSILALVAVAPFAGPVSFPGLNPTALVGGLFAAGMLAFAFSDYSRKPSFRARHAAPRPTRATPATGRAPAAANCDWTYNTRAA
ncbi:MAG: hypothetical protein EXS37_11945 [Opitutus sp.]|nr:hypothetical protein [Opitutus sp.]